MKRLRRAGVWLFAASIALGMLVYRIEVARYEPTILELMPDSAARIERQRGILFGRAGVAMFDWFEALQRPGGHAFLVIVAGFIGAAACYQVAHRIEVEEG